MRRVCRDGALFGEHEIPCSLVPNALCQFAQMAHGVVILRPQQPYPTPNFSSLDN